MPRAITGLVLATTLLCAVPAGAALRFVPPDETVVERAEVIAVGYLRPETIEYVPHVRKDEARSWEHHVILVVEHFVKGRREEVEIPIVLQYMAVTPQVGPTWGEDFARLSPADREALRGQPVVLVSDREVAADASQSQIWFLRTVGDKPYGRQPSTGWLGILDAADVQPLERLSYFQAYLAADPEAAVAEQARRDPAVAERSRVFLEGRQIRRILALPDPKERVQALLPFYAQPGPSIHEARKGIVAAGAMAGPLLVPLFENPTRPWVKGDVIRLWGEIGYRDAVPRLIRLLHDEDAFWAPYDLKPGWWSRQAEAGLPPEASVDHYNPLLMSLYALRVLGDPSAREAVEMTLRRWSTIPDTTQIAEECQHYLKAIGAL